jgi:hypothetical protein
MNPDHKNSNALSIMRMTQDKYQNHVPHTDGSEGEGGGGALELA